MFRFYFLPLRFINLFGAWQLVDFPVQLVSAFWIRFFYWVFNRIPLTAVVRRSRLVFFCPSGSNVHRHGLLDLF